MRREGRMEFGIIRNYMASIIAPKKAESVASLGVRLRQLQGANKELEDSINLQMQFLSIHTRISETNSLFHPSLFQSLTQQQASLHQLLSARLLSAQIRVQEQREMDELIKSYEGRIVELHRALNNKEAEIAEVNEDEGHDSLPRKENLRKLNLESIEKHSIHRTLQELKKLRVETEALEHMVKQKISKDRGTHRHKTAKEALGGKSLPKGTTAATLKQRVDSMHRDKLLTKVYHLLKEELSKESQLKANLHSLKEEWEDANKTHQQLIKRYKKQELDKAKPFTSKKHSQTRTEMNFLEELARAQAQPIKEEAIFHKIDLNIQKQRAKRDHRAPSSRERQGLSKEN